MISVGALRLPIIDWLNPQVVVEGARRTPVPHFAPTGSDSSNSFHTASRTAGSNCASQPSCRSQLASNSLRDCVLKTVPGFGNGGGAAAPPLPYAGASNTSRL